MSATAQPATSVPSVGDEAPEFTIPSTSGDKVSLASLRGRRVLIAFFPLAFSPTCTSELCDIRDDWDAFRNRDIVVLPISVDSTYTLKEYKNKHGMRVDLLSDFKREAARRYGVLNEDRFFANRAYFLLDEKGVVRWEHIEANPSHKRSNQELLDAIDKLT